MRRPALRFLFAFLVVSALHAQRDDAPPKLLPPVTVGAAVPLVKVGEWKIRHARYGAAAVAQGDFLYLIGGVDVGNEFLTAVERVDLRNGAAEDFADLQRARFFHGAAIVGEKLYVLGGYTRGARRLELDDTVEVIDLATRKVTRGPTLPEPRKSFGCVAAQGRILVVGGSRPMVGGNRATNTMLVLDVASGRWTEGVPMPTPRESPAALVDGGFVIVPGGWDGAKERTEVEVFNWAKGVWSTLPPLATPMSAHSLVFLGRDLFLFGDYTHPDLLLAFDLKTRQSETFTLGYTPARHTAAVAHHGKVYVAGGRLHAGADPLAIVQIFAPPPKNAPGK